MGVGEDDVSGVPGRFAGPDVGFGTVARPRADHDEFVATSAGAAGLDRFRLPARRSVAGAEPSGERHAAGAAQRWRPRRVRAEADWLIEDLGVRTTAETAYVSGGEAQRLALARALITQPSLLLADEPTGALDRATRDEVLEVMFTKIRSAEMAAVIVTHDEEVAFSADRIIELSAARPVEAT
ncbi:hypothetical protein DPM12_05195 [Phytoactinopolyspora halophila]|uniref:ABC transporter domain-containing protein n=1 Tax=Phytoactinopolyspora halophila TaxID=1981511 RepID=A0A329R342_9ACTN|nr:hypothetical protein DPM12_05195 [Phytoactinopolyspora halophila]